MEAMFLSLVVFMASTSNLREFPKKLEETDAEPEPVPEPPIDDDEDVVIDNGGDDKEDVDGDGEREVEGEDEEEEEEEGGEKKPNLQSKKPPVDVGAATAAVVIGGEEDEEELELMDEGYIERVHPEVILPDTRELREVLASYTREENPVIRKSRALLTKYEAATIVSMRAQQITKGAAPLLETDTINPIDIALEELNAKLIPVIVRRVMPDGTSEYWRLSELTYYDV
jgi:DNA-directed RNA polymerases I, II, and III subunit RPABC2